MADDSPARRVWVPARGLIIPPPEVVRKFQQQGLIGKSQAMLDVYWLIWKVAPTDVPVFLRGERGTGKSLVACIIHLNSPRSDRDMVGVNCAAIPESLLESLLFGIEPGIASGVKAHLGLFEIASGSTLFLDEVADMSAALQAKILNVLQDRTMTRVGGTTAIPVEVRIIAATNQNLKRAIAEGRFREDLYDRLNVLPIVMPSLNDRREDIPLLVNTFIQRHAKTVGKSVSGIEEAALQDLIRLGCAGNVRELELTVECALVFEDSSVLRLEAIQVALWLRAAAERQDSTREEQTLASSSPAPSPDAEADALAEVEKDHVGKILRETNGDLTQAAKKLGIRRRRLERLMKKHRLMP